MKRLAAIHDLSGFGHTSLMAVIPILSTMGIQVCPLPTAVLSTGTSGFPNFRFTDLTVHMESSLEHWKELGLKFDAVYSGFLGSTRQVDLVKDCVARCLKPGGLAVVDPVLGDNGELEPTMDMDMVKAMRSLTQTAGCITPNLTEAALLLGETYPKDARKRGMDEATLRDWLRRLTDSGPETAVITGVPGATKRQSSVIAYHRAHKRFWRVDCAYLPAEYPGTGDTFTSVLTGGMLQGDSLPLAMDRAAQFVTMGIRATFGHSSPAREGIFLEHVLNGLNAPVTASSYVPWEEN
ncbi:MAG: pyridoxamine kinase [Desulfovibrio sp.]|jgi:pyridoxine kinase|nr:pyridoxamine kinase [Desulfovibrio sp.]